jgi:ribosome biogenesis GTPase A
VSGKDHEDDLLSQQNQTDYNIGLEKIAKHLNSLSNGRLSSLADVRAPQKKLYVMIIGNHSAGKSSFINWYIGEDL